MTAKLIYICSPLRGDIEGNTQKAREYCRAIVELFPDAVPIAPHLYCTQFLDDRIPEERAAGMDMALALLDKCDEVWVFSDRLSEGVLREIDYAVAHGIPVYDAAEQVRKLINEPSGRVRP